MAELKTKVNDASVAKFLKSIKDEQQRADCEAICALMTKVMKESPKMWGASIVGFGDYHYQYASGREGDWFLAGFSPRKGNTTLYLMAGFASFPGLMMKLGKYKTGSSCLYIKRYSDIDAKVLTQLIKESNAVMKKRYAGTKKEKQ